jgi:hypothetical protein
LIFRSDPTATFVRATGGFFRERIRREQCMAAASALAGFSRTAVIYALGSFVATPSAAQTIGSTFNAGDARPVKRLASPAGRAADIDLLSFDFQQPYYGFEGPGLFRVDGEPSQGARYIVTARVYGDRSVATAAFSAVDERGTVIQSIRMMREPNASGTSDLVGVMVVPDQPFRIVMAGAAVDGVEYRSTYKRLFRPTQDLPSVRRLPPDVPADLAKHMMQTADEAARQAIDRLESQLANHPEETALMPRSNISNVVYAPLFSAAGRPIGLRVMYEVEFSQDGYFDPALRAVVDYQNDEWRGLVDMHAVDGSIEPLPVEAGAPQERPSILAYGAGYQYKGNTTYRFTADLIPDFIIQNEAKTRFCIYTQKYEIYGSGAKRAVWAALLTRESSVNYKLFIGDSDFMGTVDGFFAPGTLRASFAAEGAQDCGSQPTRRF